LVQFTNPTTITSTQYNGRLDYQLNPRDLLTFSVYWTPNDTTNFNGQGARPANLFRSDGLDYSSALVWNHIFTSTFTPPALTPSGVPPVPGVGRNSFRGPRYSSIDFTLGKAFGLPRAKIIGEGAKLEFRLNFFNLLNETNLAPIGSQQIGTIQLNSLTGAQINPTTTNGLASTTFDQAQSGLAGRVIEAQMRFSF